MSDVDRNEKELDEMLLLICYSEQSLGYEVPSWKQTIKQGLPMVRLPGKIKLSSQPGCQLETKSCRY